MEKFNEAAKAEKNEAPEGVPDYTSYFSACSSRLWQTDYRRGLSQDILARFRVGFDPHWVAPTAERSHGAPDGRLIIPTSSTSYVARAVDDTTAVRYYKVGKVHLFNEDCLKSSEDPIFIVEGEIDALSIIDVGYQAAALGSKDNYQLLIDAIGKVKPKVPMIIALDHETDPAKAQMVADAEMRLAGKLDALGIRYAVDPTLYGDHKDANEALQADRKSFVLALEGAVLAAKTPLPPFPPASEMLPVLMDNIHRNKGGDAISTGFPSVDELLGGGLLPQLYIIGAKSSLGKTTFLLQIADQMSQRGQDVLFFALEMAPEDLAIKSISRLSYEVDDTLQKLYAKTALGIRSGKWIGQPDERIVKKAADEYCIQAQHLFFPAHGPVTVAEMKGYVQQMEKIGRAPVVIIDYLQLISAPENRKFPSDKAVIDANLLALKDIVIDCKVPVICISSLNRSGYAEPVDMSSYKESGNIEYTADILIGMNYAETTDIKDPREYRDCVRSEKARASCGEWVEIEIDVLKSRLSPSDSCRLQFCPRFNCFRETTGVFSPHLDMTAGRTAAFPLDPGYDTLLPVKYDDAEHQKLFEILLQEVPFFVVTTAEIAKRMGLPTARVKRLAMDCGYAVSKDGRIIDRTPPGNAN